MQVPKFRCTDKLYVQLTYFHCTAFKIKNQPFASNVLTAVSMPAVCGCKKPAAFRRRDHKGDFHRLTERVPVTRPPRPRRGPCPPVSMSIACRRRDHKGDFLCLTERVPVTRPPRLRCGTLPPASMPVVCHRRDHITDAFCPTERVPARAPRDPGVGRAY